MYGFLRFRFSKRFQNEIKIMKYVNILDMLLFVIVLCCFGLVSADDRLSGADKWELVTTALKFISVLIGREHNGYL